MVRCLAVLVDAILPGIKSKPNIRAAFFLVFQVPECVVVIASDHELEAGRRNGHGDYRELNVRWDTKK